MLISGRGSNMLSLVDAAMRPDSGFEVVGVASNRPNAPGLRTAHDRGLATVSVDHTLYATRKDFEADLFQKIAPWKPDLVCLAGFMRKLSAAMIGQFPNRILNIHPSLLPLFPGLHPHAQALASGVRVHGCTVHVVTEDLDAGPIVGQAVVPVLPLDTAETLSARLLPIEHRLYPAVVGAIARGDLEIGQSGVIWHRSSIMDEMSLMSL